MKLIVDKFALATVFLFLTSLPLTAQNNSSCRCPQNKARIDCGRDEIAICRQANGQCTGTCIRKGSFKSVKLVEYLFTIIEDEPVTAQDISSQNEKFSARFSTLLQDAQSVTLTENIKGQETTIDIALPNWAKEEIQKAMSKLNNKERLRR